MEPDGIAVIARDEADRRRAMRMKKFRNYNSLDPFTFSILDHGEGIAIISGSDPIHSKPIRPFPQIVEFDEF